MKFSVPQIQDFPVFDHRHHYHQDVVVRIMLHLSLVYSRHQELHLR